MKKIFLASAFALLVLVGCNKDKDILNSLNDYNLSQQNSGYHFGDKIEIPQDVLDYAEAITISFGDKESTDLNIDPKFFTLGENDVTFNIKTKGGEVLQQDATINVFAKAKAVPLSYEVVNQYPHSADNFTEGFEVHDNTVYESIGLEGKSKLMKYTLGTTKPLQEVAQPTNIFSEGITLFGNKIYQLTYKTKKGFIYDSNMKLEKEFEYPNIIGEGWGMTNDGKNLIVSDGTKNIYFLNPENPSEVVRYISVASDKEGYDQINELEYHNGFIYSNVWHKPIILKINPANGEVTGIIDLTNIVKQSSGGGEDVLNGIAFKGDNMLVTGKNWSRIYEISIK
ncbi:glutaminyl-peptide cyclotransferase [Epilithonimonas sp. JDS]|uniref:glutaminyl-peptide cyclotransferase n=1 Tax=Epilithonimonas sp. JDS TaxID=2902797 RepID=UPI001E3466B3|nr:glutaminyl-peptide cyclotransferase [Epilithonimonas sp. JDS]MCD9856335.1 glutaminyl-peptide cyclotransferase [Epilithonimonas sp. JDS]